jgi:hypothetical protein
MLLRPRYQLLVEGGHLPLQRFGPLQIAERLGDESQLA